MTHVSKLLVTTILVGSLAGGTAYAQSTSATATANTKSEIITEKHTRTVRPLAIDGETNEVKPAIQRFVERINMARVSLSMKRPQDASFDLDEAEKHLNFIKSNSRYEEATKTTVIASGRVQSDSSSEYNSYYIPLEEGPVVVKKIQETDSSPGKTSVAGVAVTAADVVYLNVDLTGKEAPQYIARARAAIKAGDTVKADNILGEMLSKIARTEVVETMPDEKARDNLQLSLKFLQDENYTAARYALVHARDALEQMKSDSRYDKGLSERNFNKVSQIHDLVMQQTPSTASKARTQIIEVQDSLSKI